MFSIFYETPCKWMPQDLTDDKSTLVQVLGSNALVLTQIYAVILPQWVKSQRSLDVTVTNHIGWVVQIFMQFYAYLSVCMYK